MQRNKKLTSTERYLSIDVLAGCDLSRRDDLEGMSFVMIYLERLQVKTKEEKYFKILNKKNISSEELLKVFQKK